MQLRNVGKSHYKITKRKKKKNSTFILLRLLISGWKALKNPTTSWSSQMGMEPFSWGRGWFAVAVLYVVILLVCNSCLRAQCRSWDDSPGGFSQRTQGSQPSTAPGCPTWGETPDQEVLAQRTRWLCASSDNSSSPFELPISAAAVLALLEQQHLPSKMQQCSNSRSPRNPFWHITGF